MLIQYTLEYVKQYGNENVYILTDDEDIAREYRGKYKIMWDGNEEPDVLYSINECAKKLNTEYVFYLCVTNPFRQDGILFDMIEQAKDVNMVTTKVVVPNRKIFLIDENNKFIYKSKKGRKGKYVTNDFMIDGAAYLVKCDFLKKICKTKEPNKLFWETKFNTVLNNVPFIDIDTQQDMNNFNFYKKLQ